MNPNLDGPLEPLDPMADNAPAAAPATPTPPAGEPTSERDFGALDDAALDLLSSFGSAAAKAGPAEAPSPEPPVSEEPEPDLSQIANADAPPPEPEPEPEPTPPKRELPEGVKPEDAPPTSPDWYLKRLAHYTAMAKSAQDELARLRAEQARATANAPEEPEPLAATPALAESVKQEKAAAQNLTRAEDLLDQLDEEPESVIDTLVKAKFLSEGADTRAARQFLRAQARQWGEKLHEHRTQHQLLRQQAEQTHQAQRQANDAVAVKHYPWLKDPNSREYAQAMQLLETRPHLQRDPALMLLLGMAVTEYNRLTALEQGQRKPAPPKAAPPKLPGNASAATTGGTRTEAGASAFRKAIQTGSDEDVAAALATL